MARFILRRLIFSVVLVLGVSMILFALINSIGNPMQILLSERPGVTDQIIANMTKYYGLEGKMVTRYFHWLNSLLHLNFGTSIIYNQPVGGMLVPMAGKP